MYSPERSSDPSYPSDRDSLTINLGSEETARPAPLPETAAGVGRPSEHSRVRPLPALDDSPRKEPVHDASAASSEAGAPSLAVSSESAPPIELALFMRQSFIQAGLLIAALLVAVGLAGIWFEPQILSAADWVYDTIGTAGLLALLFVNDSIVSPLPPDAALLVVAKTSLRAQWPLVVLAIGLTSALAGNMAWWIGRSLGTRLAPSTMAAIRDRNRPLVKRYGAWTVAISALTPLPFSVACLAAGALNMRYSKFWWLTLLRVPRFYVFYLTIAYSDLVVAWFR